MNIPNNFKKLFIHRLKGERIIVGEGADQVILEISRLNERSVTIDFYANPSVRIDREERRFPGVDDK